MDLLQNDVRLIVYRYLYKDTYNKVVKQYKDYWLSDSWPETYWDDNEQCFKSSDNVYVANYRFGTIIWYDIYIFRFHDEEAIDCSGTDKAVVLSDNYRHAKLY